MSDLQLKLINDLRYENEKECGEFRLKLKETEKLLLAKDEIIVSKENLLKSQENLLKKKGKSSGYFWAFWGLLTAGLIWALFSEKDCSCEEKD